jgi:atlastin
MNNQGRPLQIVTIDSTNAEEPSNGFNLIEENLEAVVSKIPKGMKVGVISVVGAFRTGKSFLLNFFLRYLRHGSSDDMSESWMLKDGLALSEGNLNQVASNSKSEEQTTAVSFEWRGGQEQQAYGCGPNLSFAN